MEPMGKEREDYVPAQEIETPGKLVRRVRYKPVLGSLSVAVLGAVILPLGFLPLTILGVLLLAGGLLSLLLTRDRRVMDVCTGGVVVYRRRDDTQALCLPWEQVEEWNAQRLGNGAQMVVFTLNDGTYVCQETLQTRSVRRTLHQYQPDKEFKTLRQNRT